MPHSPHHDAAFRHYTAHRKAVLHRITELRRYLAQLWQVVEAMPEGGRDAGYLDLDHVKQLRKELDEAIQTLCDWEGLGMEFGRLRLQTKE